MKNKRERLTIVIQGPSGSGKGLILPYIIEAIGNIDDHTLRMTAEGIDVIEEMVSGNEVIRREFRP